MNKKFETNESLKKLSENPSLVGLMDFLINHYGEDEVKKAVEQKIKK